MAARAPTLRFCRCLDACACSVVRVTQPHRIQGAIAAGAQLHTPALPGRAHSWLYVRCLLNMKRVGQPGRNYHTDPIRCILQRHSPYSTWRPCSCQSCRTPSCQSQDTTVEQVSQSKLQLCLCACRSSRSGACCFADLNLSLWTPSRSLTSSQWWWDPSHAECTTRGQSSPSSSRPAHSIHQVFMCM